MGSVTPCRQQLGPCFGTLQHCQVRPGWAHATTPWPLPATPALETHQPGLNSSMTQSKSSRTPAQETSHPGNTQCTPSSSSTEAHHKQPPRTGTTCRAQCPQAMPYCLPPSGCGMTRAWHYPDRKSLRLLAQKPTVSWWSPACLCAIRSVLTTTPAPPPTPVRQPCFFKPMGKGQCPTAPLLNPQAVTTRHAQATRCPVPWLCHQTPRHPHVYEPTLRLATGIQDAKNWAGNAQPPPLWDQQRANNTAY